MPRLNLTLDSDTFSRLDKHARKEGAQRATLAKRLLREGLAARDRKARLKKLAEDYAADRRDARELLEDFELPQLEILGEENG